MKYQQMWEKYPMYKKGNSWNSSICICENNEHLKSLADDSVIVCSEIISAMDSSHEQW